MPTAEDRDARFAELDELIARGVTRPTLTMKQFREMYPDNQALLSLKVEVKTSAGGGCKGSYRRGCRCRKCKIEHALEGQRWRAAKKQAAGCQACGAPTGGQTLCAEHAAKNRERRRKARKQVSYTITQGSANAHIASGEAVL